MHQHSVEELDESDSEESNDCILSWSFRSARFVSTPTPELKIVMKVCFNSKVMVSGSYIRTHAAGHGKHHVLKLLTNRKIV